MPTGRTAHSITRRMNGKYFSAFTRQADTYSFFDCILEARKSRPPLACETRVLQSNWHTYAIFNLNVSRLFNSDSAWYKRSACVQTSRRTCAAVPLVHASSPHVPNTKKKKLIKEVGRIISPKIKERIFCQKGVASPSWIFFTVSTSGFSTKANFTGFSIELIYFIWMNSSEQRLLI